MNDECAAEMVARVRTALTSLRNGNATLIAYAFLGHPTVVAKLKKVRDAKCPGPSVESFGAICAEYPDLPYVAGLTWTGENGVKKICGKTERSGLRRLLEETCFPKTASQAAPHTHAHGSNSSNQTV